MRSRAWVVLDCSMLLVVVVLQAWRLTGVGLHEWLAIALIGGLLAHLVLHWPWVESRSRRILAPRNGRARVNYALNFTLFLGMTAAMLSGFMISKVAFPAHPTPVEFLKWHGVHEFSSRVVLVCLGLHLGLNWDLMLAAIKNFLRRRGARPASQRTPLHLVSAVVMIVAAVTIVGTGLWGMERWMPGEILRRPDIARLRRDEIAPSTRGIPAFVMQGVLVAASTVVGRRVLRLRLD